ncbi:MAG: DUF6572 domain-containing protein [Chthoniobacteraceae bacterium]
MSLDQSNVIDAMGIDDASGRVTLVIRHDAPWDGSDPQLFLLQEKLNAYLSFALDGEMAEAHPDFAIRPLGLRIETNATPDSRTLHLLAHVRKQIEFQDITLEVRLHGGPPCDCK